MEPGSREKTGRFAKGVSGNPAGTRPVVRDFRERCKDWCSAKGWANLVAMAEAPDGEHRYRATELLYSYAYGRPPQRTELTGAEGAPVAIRYIEIAPVLGPGMPGPPPDTAG